MALDRRTLRDLLARPLIDHGARRANLVFVATGERSRQALHQISVGVAGARRQAPDHVIIQLGSRAITLPRLPGLATEIHLVAVGADEGGHPVTQQLATRAQGVIAAPDSPRVLGSVPRERVKEDDVVAAYGKLLDRVVQRVMQEHGDSAETLTPLDERIEDIPPSVGTRRCELSLLGVGGVTAVELLTVLDEIMERMSYRRCAHAGGGRDFILLRGHAGAGLRVMDDRSGSAMDLAVQLASKLTASVNVATVSADQELAPATGETKTEIEWTLEAVDASGTAAAYRNKTELSHRSPTLPLDERVSVYIADEVFSIQPEREGLAIHYERR